jgi:hypothetical protein
LKTAGTFRARFRFRMQKPLNISAKRHEVKIGERDVVLSAALPDVDISESSWLVMNAGGFENEREATRFAARLKGACELSSAAARLGVDAGVDMPTSSFGALVVDHVREQSGILLRDNIHGIDVFPDDPNVCFGDCSGTGTVLAGPDPFLSDLDNFHEHVGSASQVTRDIVLLLNYALMRPEPVAQIVFAFSAVEMLGQNEDWSTDQKRLLTELGTWAQQSSLGTVEERHEVAEAIRRGTYKLSLRQGVLRLLSSLGLEHLKRSWDDMYAQRSTLVHGLAPRPGARYEELGNRVVSLCGQILLRAVARDVPGADTHVARFYELQ